MNRIHTVLAGIAVTSAGLELVDLADGVTFAEVQRCTQAVFAVPPSGHR
jgi:acyl CoA:acetate/3-ketoacid CoA transferase beta subunit